MKLKVLTAFISSSLLLTVPQLSIAEETLLKDKMSNLTTQAYSANHLDEITFHQLFPKAFYKKSYFTPVALGTTIVVAGAFTFFTAGAGAPAAATGVGAVATAVGGGGAGAYMAGLSAIGSFFGGNAILGAAILNGISLGTIGSSTALALSIAAKTATLTTIGFTGLALIPAKDGQARRYVFDLRIPHKEIGSGTLRELVQDIEEVQKDLNDALTDETNDKSKVFSLIEKRQSYYEQSNNLLKKELQKPALYIPNMLVKDLEKRIEQSYLFQSPEDLIVLSVIAYRSGEFDLFQQGIQVAKNNIAPFQTSIEIEDSYLNYLEGVAELSKSEPDITYAKQKFTQSWQQERYTLEPAVALITVLGDEAQGSKVKLAEIVQLTDKVADQFDSDKYVSRVNKMGLYFNTATIYLRARDYSSALKYYRLASDAIGFMARYSPREGSIDMVNNIRIMKAVCLFKLNKGAEAAEIFNEIMDDYKDAPEKFERFKAIYQGA